MERSRITPRLRPRPYDLRRKVLKNFFREQMTYIPPMRSTVETPLDVNNGSDVDENELNSNANEGNILTPKKVQDNIVTPIPVPEPAPTTSNCCEKENSNNLDNSPDDETSSNMSEVEERPPPKFSRLSRFMEHLDSRLSVKKNRRRGITKAKHELRSGKGILKPAGRKLIKDTESSTKVKPKSFFEMLKSRREVKRKYSPISRISNLFRSRNPSPPKSDSKVATTSTQSVQTDMSWSPDHYEKMEQSHRSLLEENRLLSESLSSIISNTDFRSNCTPNSCVTDPYTISSGDSTAYVSRKQRPDSNTLGNPNHFQPYDSSGTRILRSKSLQNKRSVASSRLRTRSFNYRYAKRPYDTESLVTNKPCSEQQPYKVNVNPLTSPVATRGKARPSALKSIDTLPLYNTNTTSLLQTFSSKSGKAIIRRSSMPERTYNWNTKLRPIRSSSMRENNSYSYTSVRVSPRLNQPSSRRRSTTINGYSCSVPFQDLPAEAFY